VIYPQSVTDTFNVSDGSRVAFTCHCLHADCSKLVSYREWIDGQGYCNKHAVELGKVW
jgi:hypothetical protein